MPTLLETVQARFDEAIGRMRGIEDAAAADNRDELTDIEQSTWDELRDQADTFAQRLEILASRETLDQRASATLARVTSGRSATAGSRLLCSMRSAASWCHPRQEMVLPRGVDRVRSGATDAIGNSPSTWDRARKAGRRKYIAPGRAGRGRKGARGGIVRADATLGRVGRSNSLEMQSLRHGATPLIERGQEPRKRDEETVRLAVDRHRKVRVVGLR